MKRLLLVLLGVAVVLQSPPRRSQRGLSQSAENAILLAGAVAVATIIITAITIFVKSNLPK